MSPRKKGASTARKKGPGKSLPGARAGRSVHDQPRSRAAKPAPLRVIPAAPIAAFGLGELLIRAWAARQHAA